eukprot:372674-Pelagomonas_calceolata.AAC.1
MIDHDTGQMIGLRLLVCSAALPAGRARWWWSTDLYALACLRKWLPGVGHRAASAPPNCNYNYKLKVVIEE